MKKAFLFVAMFMLLVGTAMSVPVLCAQLNNGSFVEVVDSEMISGETYYWVEKNSVVGTYYCMPGDDDDISPPPDFK